MTTASEIRAAHSAGMLTLQTWADELEQSCIQPLVKKLIDELFALDRRVWARYDRCCHGGRNCLPPADVFPDFVWRPNAYAVNPRRKD